MINKYIYTLLRSEYVSNGCQNYKVTLRKVKALACCK